MSSVQGFDIAESDYALAGGDGLRHGCVHVWLAASGRKILSRPTPGEALQRRHDAQNLLLRLLSACTGRPVETDSLRTGEQGKPWLPDGPHFNLSHSAEASAVAISPCEVGIDIEHPSRAPQAVALAERFFHRDECSQIRSAPHPTSAFLEFWVCKEAMVKLSGEGIYRGLPHARVLAGGGDVHGFYRGKRVFLTPLGEQIGMTGALALWEDVPVKMVVIGKKSERMSRCHFKISDFPKQ